jgi:hypothetical protein
VRKSGFRSDGSIAAADGASGSHGQLSERGTIPTPKMVRLRVESRSLCLVEYTSGSLLLWLKVC